MPHECPIHLNRDFFKKKKDSRVDYRINQWYCKVCGKTFLTENQVDIHFDKKHINLLSIVSKIYGRNQFDVCFN